jgi:hypothetical protein
VRLLDLEFADLDVVDAAELIARRSGTGPFRYVTTPNADHLVRLHRQPELLALYRGRDAAAARFARRRDGGTTGGRTMRCARRSTKQSSS